MSNHENRDAATSWPPATVLHFLTTDDRISRVPVDPEYARDQLEQIIRGECYHALVAGGRDDWQKANTETYDAARKAVEMLLLSMGGASSHRVAVTRQSWKSFSAGSAPSHLQGRASRRSTQHQ